MAEPFTGSHWGREYEEEVKEGWTDSDSSSEDDNVQVVTPSTGRILRSRPAAETLENVQIEKIKETSEARLRLAEETLRHFREEAYWNVKETFFQAPSPSDVSGWRALSTSAPIFLRAKLYR